MAKKWKRWEDQSLLKQTIRSLLESSRSRQDLVDEVGKSLSATESDVNSAIDELLADWLVIARDSDGNIQLTEDSRDSLVKATSQGDYPGALMFLLQQDIWHPDMERFGMTDGGDDAAEASQKAQKDAAAKMVTMLDSGKVTKVAGAQGEDVTYTEVPEGAEKITSAVSMAVNATFKDEKHEFSIQEIREKTLLIDPSELAVELGAWISTNVEQFIDNRETVFRMYLSIESGMGMPVSSMFQRLYLSVPDVEEAGGLTGTLVDSMYDALDAKLIEAKSILDSDEEFIGYLFRRMAYFYELTGFVVQDGKVTQAMTQAMQGKVKINELIFDPISLTTTVAQGIGKHEGGKVREGDNKVIVKREEMPAGFGIEIEISLSPKNATPLSMY